MESQCPYCAARPRSSDDHIFPAFLGGKAMVRACKACNDKFGHSFEGAVSAHFIPAMITLRRFGVPTPKYVVWRRALRMGPEQIEYDLDSNLRAQPSRPNMWTESDGISKRVLIAEGKPGKRFVEALKKSGRNVQFVKRQMGKLELDTRVKLMIPARSDLRRLAVKLCAAVADHFGHRDVLDNSARDFLLHEGQSDPTIIDIRIHPGLEVRRRPFSHVVFVEADRVTGRCYGIVQFYGLLQIFVPMMERGFDGVDFSVCAALHPSASYNEEFTQAPRLGIVAPPTLPFNLQHDSAQQWEAWQMKVLGEMQIFDKEATLKLSLGKYPELLPWHSTTASWSIFLGRSRT